MRYANLNQLINYSTSCRSYFLSLPIPLRILLHEHGDYIRSAAELHAMVYEIEGYSRAVANSEAIRLNCLWKCKE